MTVDEAVRPPAPLVEPPVRGRALVLPVLFSITAFVGAGLLFVVQPLVARIILPSYGGAATVWSTSSLFFQTLLLLAYLYAHATTRRLGARRQPRLHLAVLALPLLVLPVVVPPDAAPPDGVSPVLWLLRTLILVIGLPFAVVATTGPLLQRWYSWTGAVRHADPYFLFAASNLGSFVGLLAYPLVIEPHLALADQRGWWSGGFLLFLGLTATCALVAQRARVAPSAPDEDVDVDRAERPDRRRVARWTGLAFLPSSLMLAVTSHLSTDVGAIPLLWVVPLAIYLATFVLAFARTGRAIPLRTTRSAVALAFAVVVSALTAGVMPVPIVIAITMTMLALVSYAAHARLAADRPAPEQLTTYYLVIAGGGALGGVLNGLVAPVVFDRVLEYQLTLVAVPWLLAGTTSGATSWLARQLAANRVRALLVLVLVALVPLTLRAAVWFGPRSTLVLLTAVAVAGMAGWVLTRVPGAMALGLLLMYSLAVLGDARGTIEQTRSFFGSYTIRVEGDMHQLVHGTTVHGAQYVDGARRRLPTTYYAPNGPLGDVFETADPDRVATIGLGAGTIAAYGRPHRSMTFFEIDPGMVRIASDPRLFSYVADSTSDIDLVVGDGRLQIAQEPPGSYDLVVLDAFSSDSIPVHLLTAEAFDVYADRLDDGGLIVAHISNRLFDLEPVLASAAERLGWHAALGRGVATGNGATPSAWVALSDDRAVIDRLRERPGWAGLGARQVPWTDDYSSILSVLR